MTDPIDDATITPEQAQALDKGQGEAEVTPEVVPEPVTPEEPAPAEVTPEPAKEPEADLPPKRSIYDDLKEKKAEGRAKDAEIARLSQELEILKQAQANADTPAEKKVADDDINAFAESIGADPEAIEALIPILEKRIKKQGAEVSQEDIDFLKKAKADQALLAEKEAFINEWDGFIPSLKAEFPHISDAELIAVRKEVDRLAHTPEFHDKEIDYIYFKSKNSLNALISPKRDSIEGSGSHTPMETTPTTVEYSSKSTPADIQKAMNVESGVSSLEIRRAN